MAFFSRTTWAIQYQKDKTSLDKNRARDDGFMDEILVKIKF